MHRHAARMKNGSLANSLEQTVIYIYIDSSRPAWNGTMVHPMITSVYYLDKLTNLWSHQLTSNSWVMQAIQTRKFAS